MNTLHAWRQTGTVSLWRYQGNQRNYPGWHLSADMAGCASLLVLLDALEEAGAGATRTVQLLAPMANVLRVPNNRGAELDAPSAVSLAMAEAPDTWQWDLDGGRMRVQLGAACLQKLRKGIMDIAAGEGDYSIGGADMDRLWFWWWPQG